MRSLAVLLLASVATAQADTFKPPADAVLSGLFKQNTKIPLESTPTIRGAASYALANKRVDINWYFTVAGAPGQYQHPQVENVSYWVTDLANMGDNRIAVAGVDIRGKTLIEVWEFDDVPDLVANYVNGSLVVPHLNIGIVSKTEVYREKTPGRKYVTEMFSNMADPDRLFVRFWDSKEIYDLDTQDSTIEKVLSPEAGGDSSVMQAPNLEFAYNSYFSADHSDFGYIYWLFYDLNTEGSSYYILVMKDSNRDGSIDTSELVPPASWGPLGYNDPSKIVKVM